MVLELKEYTMASLSYKSLENPLISTKQTCPSPFYIKTRAPLLLSGLPLLRSSSSSPPPCDFRRQKGRRRRRPPSQIHRLFLLPFIILTKTHLPFLSLASSLLCFFFVSGGLGGERRRTVAVHGEFVCFGCFSN